MPKRVRKPDHISQEDWDAVDSPPLTDEELSQMRPAREVIPDIIARATRGLGKKPRKTMIAIRLDQNVVEAFKATGKGWQGRVNATLLRDVTDGRIIGPDERPRKRSKKAKAAAKPPAGRARKQA